MTKEEIDTNRQIFKTTLENMRASGGEIWTNELIHEALLLLTHAATVNVNDRSIWEHCIEIKALLKDRGNASVIDFNCMARKDIAIKGCKSQYYNYFGIERKPNLTLVK